MKTRDFADLLGVLRAATPDRPVLVVTHERPDGDAIGSSAAITLLLRENGIAADLYLPGDIPDCYTGFIPPDRKESFLPVRFFYFLFPLRKKCSPFFRFMANPHREPTAPPAIWVICETLSRTNTPS